MLICGQFALQSCSFIRGSVGVARYFDRHLPNERFDPASSGVVFTTVKQRNLSAKIC